MNRIWAIAFSLLLPAGAGADLTTGLQGYWGFDGNSNDASVNSRHASLAGAAGYGTGNLGQALSLNGNTANHAYRSEPNEFNFGSDFTIQVWTKFNGFAGEQTLLESFATAGGPGWTLTTLSAGALQFYIGNTGVSPEIHHPFNANPSFSPGSWYQLVVRRTGTLYEILVNNQVVLSEVFSAAPGDSNRGLMFGRRTDYDAYPLNGLLDEVGIWNRSLENAELTSLYGDGHGDNSFLMVPVPDAAGLGVVGILGLVTACRRQLV
ncbi:MAG: LamG domain-containing protein [Phycisphaerales bacterium]|nr:LamG domain-containing protein [Phycisphaerales bacterium]